MLYAGNVIQSSSSINRAYNFEILCKYHWNSDTTNYSGIKSLNVSPVSLRYEKYYVFKWLKYKLRNLIFGILL